MEQRRVKSSHFHFTVSTKTQLLLSHFHFKQKAQANVLVWINCNEGEKILVTKPPWRTKQRHFTSNFCMVVWFSGVFPEQTRKGSADHCREKICGSCDLPCHLFGVYATVKEMDVPADDCDSWVFSDTMASSQWKKNSVASVNNFISN